MSDVRWMLRVLTQAGVRIKGVEELAALMLTHFPPAAAAALRPSTRVRVGRARGPCAGAVRGGPCASLDIEGRLHAAPLKAPLAMDEARIASPRAVRRQPNRQRRGCALSPPATHRQRSEVAAPRDSVEHVGVLLRLQRQPLPQELLVEGAPLLADGAGGAAAIG